MASRSRIQQTKIIGQTADVINILPYCDKMNNIFIIV